MHTFQDEEGDVSISYNGDMSGDVFVRRWDWPDGAPSLAIPLSSLLSFVAMVVRQATIARIEQTEDEEILGMKIPPHPPIPGRKRKSKKSKRSRSS